MLVGPPGPLPALPVIARGSELVGLAAQAGGAEVDVLDQPGNSGKRSPGTAANNSTTSRSFTPVLPVSMCSAAPWASAAASKRWR